MRGTTWFAVSALMLGFTGLAHAQEWKVEAKVCKTIEARECVGESDTFSVADGSLAVWTKVTGPGSGTIKHVYFNGDQQTDEISLNVGGSPWRVNSRKTLKAGTGVEGNWRVEIRDPAGAVLETKKFTVTGDGTATSTSAAMTTEKETATPEATPAASTGTTMASGDMKVEAKTCKKVENRECADATDTFTIADGQVAVWTKVTGGSGEIHHVYFFGDKQTDDITLNVGGSPWRVHSRKTLRADVGMQGEWRVEVRDGSGAVLETLKFKVQ